MINEIRHPAYVFAPNRLDDFVRWGSQQFGDDRELIDMIFARKQRFALQHLGEYASRAPNVNLYIVLLPREHNLRRTIVPRGNISRHLRILNSSEPKIANLQIAILVDQNVAWLQVPMDHSSGVNIFEPTLPSSVPVSVMGVQDRDHIPRSDRESIE